MLPQKNPFTPASSITTLVLPETTSRRLGHRLLLLPNPYVDLESFILGAMAAVVTTLSPQDLRAIISFKREFTAPGALLIRNLPTDETLPQTPSTGGRSIDKATYISEACIVGVNALLGDIYAYHDEKKGEFIHNICPVQSSRTAL